MILGSLRAQPPLTPRHRVQPIAFPRQWAQPVLCQLWTVPCGSTWVQMEAPLDQRAHQSSCPTVEHIQWLTWLWSPVRGPAQHQGKAYGTNWTWSSQQHHSFKEHSLRPMLIKRNYRTQTITLPNGRVQPVVLSAWEHSLWPHLTRGDCRTHLVALSDQGTQPVAPSGFGGLLSGPVRMRNPASRPRLECGTHPVWTQTIGNDLIMIIIPTCPQTLPVDTASTPRWVDKWRSLHAKANM